MQHTIKNILITYMLLITASSFAAEIEKAECKETPGAQTKNSPEELGKQLIKVLESDESNTLAKATDLILSQRADVNVKNKDGKAPIIIACQKNTLLLKVILSTHAVAMQDVREAFTSLLPKAGHRDVSYAIRGLLRSHSKLPDIKTIERALVEADIDFFKKYSSHIPLVLINDLLPKVEDLRDKEKTYETYQKLREIAQLLNDRFFSDQSSD